VKVIETSLPGVLVVEPDVHRDARGYFMETFHAERYRAAGIPTRFMQANQSRSTRGTLRGLHWQAGTHPQKKLVRVVVGDIFDVAVGIDPDSPAFGRWFGVRLQADNFRQLFIPEGYAHGFCVLSEVADIEYHCSDIYDPASERGVMWDDPELGIDWPVASPLLSDRDRRHPSLRSIRDAAMVRR
jgi:dTDP-4-dehydrorhamnose 3,5-epimerase